MDYALSQSTLEQVFLKQIRPAGFDNTMMTVGDAGENPMVGGVAAEEFPTIRQSLTHAGQMPRTPKMWDYINGTTSPLAACTGH